MKNILFISLIITFASLYSEAQTKKHTVIRKNKENRFIGKVDVDCKNVDYAGLIKDFTLNIEWWTLIGEPIEKYITMWTSTNEYTINGKTISYYELGKYPDLQKRFKTLSPIKINIILEGYAIGNTIRKNPYTKKIGVHKAIKYKTKLGYTPDNDVLSFNKFIKYEVKDRDMLFGPAGKEADGISAASPMYWNEFIIWDSHNREFAVKDLFNDSINVTPEQYKKLNEKQRNELDGILKYLFNKTINFYITAKLKDIKWPDAEMEYIIDEYERRERGEAPSPMDIIEQANKENENLTIYDTNDYWSEPDEPIDIKYIIKYDDNYKYGVVSERTGRILIPFNFDEIIKYEHGIAKVKKVIDYKVEKYKYCDNLEYSTYIIGTVGSSGEWITQEKHAGIYVYSLPKLTLTSHYYNLTPEERRKKEERTKELERKKKLCKEKRTRRIEELKNYYKSNGYIID